MKKIILMICLLFTPGVTIIVTPNVQAAGPILELDPAEHWEGGNPRINVNTMDVQCALKGAIFGHSWQKRQEGISEVELIEQLVIKLTEVYGELTNNPHLLNNSMDDFITKKGYGFTHIKFS